MIAKSAFGTVSCGLMLPRNAPVGKGAKEEEGERRKNVRQGDRRADEEKHKLTRTANRIVELRSLDTVLHHTQDTPIDSCEAVFFLLNRESIRVRQRRW